MNLPIDGRMLLTPVEMQKRLGEKAKTLRLFFGYKRVTLSEKSGVSAATIRNFEQTGKINLENFLRLVFVLNQERKLDDLFELPEIASLKELEQRKQPSRKRGRR